MAEPSGNSLVSFIQRAIREGMGPTATLRAFRETGLKIQTQRFYQAFSNTRDGMANSANVSQLPGHLRPDDNAFTPWATRKEGWYVYQVKIQVFDKDTQTTTSRDYTHFSKSKISPNKAIKEGVRTFNEGLEGSEEYENEVILGGFVSGLYITEKAEGGV